MFIESPANGWINKIPKKKPNCKPRQYWIRPGHTNGWWLGFHQNRVAPSEWKENFRMSRESFLVLCTELNDHIVKNSTRFRKAVSVEEQVALMLYYLSDEGRLRKTANAFGLRKSSVSHIIRRVYEAITVHLTSKWQGLKRLLNDQYRNFIQNTLSSMHRSY